ncbi:MAG: hypothetical protein SNJ52_01410 [Verrucomicrobiia bacterium]
MKHRIQRQSMRTLLLVPIAATTIFLTGCEVTGDPTQGGIFWSEGMAQQRLLAREQELGRIESNTAYQQRRARQLERQLSH